MKRLLFYFVLGGFVFFNMFSSCSNEIQVVGDWKEIPIVYGVFNPEPLDNPNAISYFRIEKAFLDPKTDALIIAKIADSLYYAENEIDVILNQYSHGNPCLLTLSDTLVRVNAEEEGFEERDSGIFATTPNILYKTTKNFTNGQYFRLTIKNNRTGKEFTSNTRGVYTSAIDIPNQSYNNFSITAPSIFRPLKWVYYDNRNSNWVFNEIGTRWEEPLNGAIYDLSVIFHYDEYEVADNGGEVSGTRVSKSIVWHPVKNYIRQGTTNPKKGCSNPSVFYNIYSADAAVAQQPLNGENFLRFIASKLSDVNGTNTRRCAGHVDYRLDCAGPDLAEYIRSRNSNQNLIGGLFPADPFTNIEEGYGIFTTKSYVQRLNYLLDDDVLEYLSLPDGITGNKGFINTACF